MSISYKVALRLLSSTFLPKSKGSSCLDCKYFTQNNNSQKNGVKKHQNCITTEQEIF